MTWKNSVSQSSGAVPLSDVSAFISGVASPPLSAIDDYYSAAEPILVSIGPDFFIDYDDRVSALLYIGLISATENYFRNVLGFILEVCPVAKNSAVEEKVQLGSYLWSGAGIHSRTAFDFIAFSSGKNISDTFQKFIGYQVKTGGVWKSMLGEYDKLCEIRHGVVHSGLVLSGKNALKLGLSPTSASMRVSPTFATVQEAGAICTTLVQAANNELFELMIKRWAVDWRALPSWRVDYQTKALRRVYEGFFSSRDNARGAITTVLSFRTFMKRVKSEFNI